MSETIQLTFILCIFVGTNITSHDMYSLQEAWIKMLGQPPYKMLDKTYYLPVPMGLANI